MPIRISEQLPAAEILREENSALLEERVKTNQPIKVLKIALLNLMPTKVETETQLLRLLGNSPLPLDITLLHPESHLPQNTPLEHLQRFYTTFGKVRHQKFDGLIITGAPVEQHPFETVDYWQELCEIMAWSLQNVRSTLHICWGAQASLYYHYGINKHPLPQKLSGVFAHRANRRNASLLQGFDDTFWAPQSRYTEVLAKDILQTEALELLSQSNTAGVYLAASKDGKQVFITGHPEYDPLTLKKEYDRDVKAGLETALPHAYFPEDDPSQEPLVIWRSHAALLFLNWLNYYVYDEGRSLA